MFHGPSPTWYLPTCKRNNQPYAHELWTLLWLNLNGRECTLDHWCAPLSPYYKCRIGIGHTSFGVYCNVQNACVIQNKTEHANKWIVLHHKKYCAHNNYVLFLFLWWHTILWYYLYDKQHWTIREQSLRFNSMVGCRVWNAKSIQWFGWCHEERYIRCWCTLLFIAHWPTEPSAVYLANG